MSFIYEYTLDITVKLFIRPIKNAKLITYTTEVRNNKFMISPLIKKKCKDIPVTGRGGP
jgi:hypothetical protein